MKERPVWMRSGEGWWMCPPEHIIVSPSLKAAYGFDQASKDVTIQTKISRLPQDIESEVEKLIVGETDYNRIADTLGISAFEVFEILERSEKIRDKEVENESDDLPEDPY